jgi:hypothetical protein
MVTFQRSAGKVVVSRVSVMHISATLPQHPRSFESTIATIERIVVILKLIVVTLQCIVVSRSLTVSRASVALFFTEGRSFSRSACCEIRFVIREIMFVNVQRFLAH